ncbi:GroES-like protein [Phaeosphaeriaceae sp. SRC1lsM3a]|nr:GroES-like protein [Stagonospora sp. SRC1lsM3a]
MKNPSLVVTSDHTIRMEEASVLEPGAGEVLLHVRTSGICGSDVHFWRHGCIGDLTVDGDCILGHEASGDVVKLGPGVIGLTVGDRVAVEPGVPCGQCFICIEGRYNLCDDVAFAGVYPHHGSIQRYKVHSARFVHKLPTSISHRTSALLEPLSVAMHALRVTPIDVGTPVAIFGAGPIGLLTMAIARASGAHPIVITDVDVGRLEFAKAFEPRCLTHQVDISKTARESADAVRKLFNDDSETKQEHRMPELLLECTGVESSIVTASYTVRRGGRINFVGVSSRPLVNNLPFMHLSLAEVQLRFINRYHRTWGAGLAALEGGLIDAARLDQLVTHEFKLESAVEAMKMVAEGPARGDNVVKVHIIDDELVGF